MTDDHAGSANAVIGLGRSSSSYLLSCSKGLGGKGGLTFGQLPSSPASPPCSQYDMETRTTPDNITEVADNEVFVFGSNTVGRHGKGAAKTAMKWGAKYGHGEGLVGRTYGIPTKGHDMRVSLPLKAIEMYASRFLHFADLNRDLTFLVTEIGCGLAGFKPKDIAPLFRLAVELPNVHLPASFWRHITK